MPKVHGKTEVTDGKYDLDRDGFIKEVSIQTGFTLADTKLFLDGFVEVFKKAILGGTPLSIRGLGHLTFSEISERRGFNARKFNIALKSDPNTNREDFFETYPPALRMNFQLSANLRDLLRAEDKKKIKRS